MSKIIKKMKQLIVETKLPLIVVQKSIFGSHVAPITKTHFVDVLNSVTLCNGVVNMLVMRKKIDAPKSDKPEYFYITIIPANEETHVFKLDDDGNSEEVIFDLEAFGLNVKDGSVYFNAMGVGGYELVKPQIGDRLSSGFQIVNIDDENGCIIIANENNVTLEISELTDVFEMQKHDLVYAEEEKETMFGENELFGRKNQICTSF